MIVRVRSHTIPGAFIAFDVSELPAIRSDAIARGRYVAGQLGDKGEWMMRSKGIFRLVPFEVAATLDAAPIVEE